MMDTTSSDGSSTFSTCCSVIVGDKRKRNEYGDSCNASNRGALPNNTRGSSDNGYAGRGEDSAAQPKISECGGVGPKFNDFDELREEVNFALGQTWAIYDTADGMPRLYARITKLSAPSFGLRITYLEPEPDHEKEILWFDEGLPVSVGKFRFGKNQNTKDRSIFSHVICCGEIYNKVSKKGHFIVSPLKGETWALFKNWDINWSSEPDSYRKFEYDFVEILSNYTDGAGVSVAFLHKAKGFASVFFRMGTGDAHISRIPPDGLYRFSHRIPSFKLTEMGGKYAYELDQAALPETIKESIVPSHLLRVLAALKPKPEAVLPKPIKEIIVPPEVLAVPTTLKSKPEVLCFLCKGKVFQTGQIWSYYSNNWNLPVYYGRIKKITFSQSFGQATAFKLHVTRLKPVPFCKRMPISCGTFLVGKGTKVIDPDDVSYQIVPQTVMDGNKYTIHPKIGDVWAIYTILSHHTDEDLERWYDYEIVEVLDDALDYKVLALEPALFVNEDKGKTKFLRAAERRQHDLENESEVVFTIPKSKNRKFSHKIPVSRVTKEIDGDLKELFEVLDSKALPSMAEEESE